MVGRPVFSFRLLAQLLDGWLLNCRVKPGQWSLPKQAFIVLQPILEMMDLLHSIILTEIQTNEGQSLN